MHARALANMKYYVKTAHGISERFYRALRSYLLFGTGQGSGASPSVWLTLVICPSQFLWTKANTFAARLLTSNLNRMDTFIFHLSTHTPAMTYSICLMTLSRTQLNKIQSKAILAILDKLGVNRHFPRRAAFGPKELCGMSLLDLSVEQGIRQIQHFMDHIFALIMIALRFLQIEAGSGHHLLEAPSIEIPYLTPCWITSMREFIAMNQIKLEVTDAQLVPLSRENDRYLMDDFRHLHIFDDADLSDINLCRIFLQLTTLSDITDGSGTQITEEAFQGKCLSDRRSMLRWPRQLVVTTRQGNLWKKAVEAAYTSTCRTLHQPLGKWTGTSNQIWKTFYDTESQYIVTTGNMETTFTEYTIVS